MSKSFHIATRAEELAAIRGEWLELLARSAHDEPTRSPLWLEPWWQAYGDDEGRRLRVGLWRHDGRLVGVAPLVRRRARWRGLLDFERLDAMGSGERQEDESCSDYLGLVVERDREAEVHGDFAAALSAGAFGPIDEIVVPQMVAPADGDDAAAHLARALGDAGWMVDVSPSDPAPYTPLAASWDEQLKSLDQDRRYKLRRAVRDFEKWSGGKHQVRVARTPAELDEGFAVLCSLHGERWSERGHGGAFGSPRFTAFHRAVTRALLAHRALELSWIVVGDEPVVAVYNIIWNKKVYFYQSGRKLDLPKGVKPGLAAHAYAMQRAIAAGLTEYDFLAGVSRYKQDLAPAQRRLCRLYASRPSARERARQLTERGLALARRWRQDSV